MMVDRNRSPDIGPPPRPIAIELDLCLYRAVSEGCGGRVVLPFGVRQLIKDFAFMSFDNQTLPTAVRLWCSDRVQALQLYGDINDWNVSRVTNMALLFDDASHFNDRIDRWDVRNVTSMDRMFCRAIAFNQPLSTWNIHRVTTMKGMFCDAAAFNQPLDTWDVSKVTDMRCMFHRASSFKQPLTTWAVVTLTRWRYRLKVL
jgi:surface protein